MMRKKSTTMMVLSVFFMVAAWGLQAADLYVTTTEDLVPGSLRAAITTANNSSEDTVIHLPAGQYILGGTVGEDGNAGGDLDITSTHTVSIKGANKNTVIIDGAGKDRVLHILNGVVIISNVTVLNGNTPRGTITAINADPGAGINNSGDLTLENCLICNNTTGEGYECTTTESPYGGNGGNGGGIANFGTLTLQGCRVENNTTGKGGDAFTNPIHGPYLKAAGAGGDGGGIYNGNKLTLYNSMIRDNKTGDGGQSAHIWYSCTKTGNGGKGGGIYSSGSLWATRCNIHQNSTGSAVYSGWDGACSGDGGSGGGVFNSGNLYLSNSTLSKNYTGNGSMGDGGGTGEGGHGGGLYNSGNNSQVINCTFSGNYTDDNLDIEYRYIGNGGGIFNTGGNLALINCTLADNKIGKRGYSESECGGGIYNDSTGSVKLKNTLLANNQAGAFNYGPDGYGTFESLGYNLIENTQDCITTGTLTGNITGVDPKLNSLKNNGGPTLTHALLPTSPAIDAGNSPDISTDQRGYPRPVDIPGIPNVGDGSDIGAYELEAGNSITISGTITHGGNGLANVTLAFSNNGGTATSDAQGNYTHVVNNGWSGTVTPSKTGFTFTPSTRSYTNVTTSQTQQDYTALPDGGVTYTLTVQSSPDTGVTITVSPADKNNNSNGTTNFTRTYYKGTTVTLTAPATFNGKEFSKWVIDGNQNTSSTVQVTMNSNHTASAQYVTPEPPEPPVISLNRTGFHFGVKLPGGENLQTGNQTLLISNHGGGTLQWSAVPSAPWLLVSPFSGTGNSEVLVSVNAAGLSEGTYTGTIMVSDPAAANSPQTANVTLKVFQDTTPPFGSFDTPVEGAVVQGSIAVTGWALDDIGIDSVKIYRDENNTPVYIGDAVLVEGARPDIEATYPDYPNNDKAGWGYMLLTHFLPNQGNGTFTLYAQAADKEGHTVILGTKTITCDNAHAVRPFGAIDTPAQGGTASGSHYLNHGWVLTPPPNTIPIDGSTIQVWVDGISLGNPVYNQNRPDVAALFPGYNNSNGAGGYFVLDTTGYENGVHTIFWTAMDNAGNIDGIGSRYFTIQNLSGSNEQRDVKIKNYKLQITNKLQIPNYKSQKEEVPFGDAARRSATATYKVFNACGEAFFTTGHRPLATGQLFIRKGYNPNSEPEALSPDENGQYTIEIKELERVVLYLEDDEPENNSGEYEIRSYNIIPNKDSGEPCVHPIISNSHLTLNTQHSTLKNTPSNQYDGYLVSGDEIKSLPIGSTLDRRRGVFYWQPGPGFLGEYRLVFIKTDQEGNISGKDVQVNIIPKF